MDESDHYDPVGIINNFYNGFQEGFQGALLNRGENNPFQNIPVEHHDQALEQLNQALRRHSTTALQQAARSNSRHRINRYVHVIWLLNALPLPVVKYNRLWRDFRPNIRYIVAHAATVAFVAATRVFRLVMFCMGSLFYLSHVARIFLTFSDELTFSRNFFRDILTYVLQNNQSLFDLSAVVYDKGFHAMLEQGWDPASSTRMVSMWRYTQQFVRFMLTVYLNNKCDDQGEVTQCRPDKSSLIFKFHDVLLEFGHGSTIVVVGVYFTYAIVGNIICMNVFSLVIFYWARRASKFSTYVQALLGVAYKGLGLLS